MSRARLYGVGFIVLLAGLAAACSKLGTSEQAANDGAPDEGQLQKISYMSSDAGPKGRRLYTRLEEARSCADLELAMRWNRPPNVEGGPFHKKLHYVGEQFPADLPKDTEVFVTARIERGQMLPGGGAAWLLHTQDGPLIQAIESTNFWEKQEQDSQAGQPAAVVQPTKPGRAFCGHGVYQGTLGKDPDRNAPIPLISMLFSMDREG